MSSLGIIPFAGEYFATAESTLHDERLNSA
jgi:hypothetical protein